MLPKRREGAMIEVVGLKGDKSWNGSDVSSFKCYGEHGRMLRRVWEAGWRMDVAWADHSLIASSVLTDSHESSFLIALRASAHTKY